MQAVAQQAGQPAQHVLRRVKQKSPSIDQPIHRVASLLKMRQFDTRVPPSVRSACQYHSVNCAGQQIRAGTRL